MRQAFALINLFVCKTVPPTLDFSSKRGKDLCTGNSHARMLGWCCQIFHVFKEKLEIMILKPKSLTLNVSNNSEFLKNAG